MSDSTGRGFIGRVWHDPVFSKVIGTGIGYVLGGLITAGIATAGIWFFGLWPSIARAASHLVAVSYAPSGVPNVIVVGLTASTIGLVVTIVGVLARRPWTLRPGPRSYLEDQFIDMTWRWQWIEGSWKIKRLQFFCRDCDYEILPFEPQHYGRSETIFHCQRCGKERAREQSTLAMVCSAYEREIDRKRRSGEWRTAVKMARSRPRTV